MNVIIVILVIIFIALLGVILYQSFFLTKKTLAFLGGCLFYEEKNFNCNRWA